MIQITPQMRILVAVAAVDFRAGIDGLCGICRRVLKEDPFQGQVFVFRNRRGSALKILMYDGQGFWLCQKRLSTGRFQWWPEGQDGRLSSLAAQELQLLIWNGNPDHARMAPAWRRVGPSGSN